MDRIFVIHSPIILKTRNFILAAKSFAKFPFSTRHVVQLLEYPTSSFKAYLDPREEGTGIIDEDIGARGRGWLENRLIDEE